MKKTFSLLIVCFLAHTLMAWGQIPVKTTDAPKADTTSTVYDPLIANSNTRILDWAISQTVMGSDGIPYSYYKILLNSLNGQYSLFVPTDTYFSTYIDPIAYGQAAPQAGLQFKFNQKTQNVYAVVRKFSKSLSPRVLSDSIGVITDLIFIQNRLLSILESHIVEGNIESGNHYFMTLNNDVIRVKGSGTDLKVEGGMDIQEETPSKVTTVFKQTNGNTYFIDKPIQASLKSVYSILSETPEFSNFFNLLKGVPDTCASQLFTQQGVDYRVDFFYTYRYTVYVPTNMAIQAAMDQGLIKSWETINAITSASQKAIEINKMIRFLKYHFQDEAVFVGQNTNNIFSTATIKNDQSTTFFQSAKNRFYKLGVKADETSLTLTTEKNQTARVVTTNGLYNIIAKDYLFSKTPSWYKNADGSGAASGTAFHTSTIQTSSSAVIHQIDQVLLFQ